MRPNNTSLRLLGAPDPITLHLCSLCTHTIAFLTQTFTLMLGQTFIQQTSYPSGKMNGSWLHYLATRIWSTSMPLDTSKSLPDRTRPLYILLGPGSNCHVPLWQMPNNVTYCQQVPTDQAGGWAALSWWRCHWMAGDISGWELQKQK